MSDASTQGANAPVSIHDPGREKGDSRADALQKALDGLKRYASELPRVHYSHAATGPAIAALEAALSSPVSTVPVGSGDRAGALVALIREFADQKLPSEMTATTRRHASFEEGYITFVEKARAALKQAPSGAVIQPSPVGSYDDGDRASRLEDALRLVLPLAKGYAPEGQTATAKATCRSWIEAAEEALALPSQRSEAERSPAPSGSEGGAA